MRLFIPGAILHFHRACFLEGHFLLTGPYLFRGLRGIGGARGFLIRIYTTSHKFPTLATASLEGEPESLLNPLWVRQRRLPLKNMLHLSAKVPQMRSHIFYCFTRWHWGTTHARRRDAMFIDPWPSQQQMIDCKELCLRKFSIRPFIRESFY